jgi:hypothetical protein
MNFDISVTLHTNANGLPGFGSGTGFIFDQTGQPLQAPVVLGSAASDDGAIFLGLFPLFDGVPANARFYGFHMNITLPNNPCFEITGEDLRLFGGQIQVADQVVQGQFGIGPHVADTGITATLFAFALLVLSTTSNSACWAVINIGALCRQSYSCATRCERFRCGRNETPCWRTKGVWPAYCSERAGRRCPQLRGTTQR